jgi:hypothetical protein
MDGAWIPFGNCTCYKWCSCWKLVVLRTLRVSLADDAQVCLRPFIKVLFMSKL